MRFAVGYKSTKWGQQYLAIVEVPSVSTLQTVLNDMPEVQSGEMTPLWWAHLGRGNGRDSGFPTVGSGNPFFPFEVKRPVGIQVRPKSIAVLRPFEVK